MTPINRATNFRPPRLIGAAKTGKAPRRVGVVFSTDPQTSRPYLDALADGIEQHGHQRECDDVLEVRPAEGRPERLALRFPRHSARARK